MAVWNTDFAVGENKKKTSGNLSFTSDEAIRAGWEVFKSRYQLVLAAFVVIFVVSVVPQMAIGVLPENAALVGAVLALVLAAVQLVVSAGWIKMVLALIDNKPTRLNDLFSQVKLLGRIVVGGGLYSLIVLGGFLLLVVPGVIWSIKYQFYIYLIVDRGMGPMEAIKESGRITQGVKWRLLVLQLVLWLVNVAGVLALGVGLLVTVPVSAIAVVWVYRRLSPVEVGG